MHTNSQTKDLKNNSVDLARHFSEEGQVLAKEIKSTIKDVTQKYDEARESAGDVIKKYPFASVSIAAATGYIVAKVMKSFK